SSNPSAALGSRSRPTSGRECVSSAEVTVFELTEVERLVPDPRLLAGGALDAPLRDARGDSHALEVRGWVVGAGSPAERIELVGEEGVVRSAPVRQARQDIGSRHHGPPGADRAGFPSALGP